MAQGWLWGPFIYGAMVRWRPSRASVTSTWQASREPALGAEADNIWRSSSDMGGNLARSSSATYIWQVLQVHVPPQIASISSIPESRITSISERPTAPRIRRSSPSRVVTMMCGIQLIFRSPEPIARYTMAPKNDTPAVT